jgi:hypothetical protein
LKTPFHFDWAHTVASSVSSTFVNISATPQKCPLCGGVRTQPPSRWGVGHARRVDREEEVDPTAIGILLEGLVEALVAELGRCPDTILDALVHVLLCERLRPSQSAYDDKAKGPL